MWPRCVRQRDVIPTKTSRHSCLGPVAHRVDIIDCPPCAHRIGDSLDQGCQHGAAGQSENEADLENPNPGGRSLNPPATPP